MFNSKLANQRAQTFLELAFKIASSQAVVGIALYKILDVHVLTYKLVVDVLNILVAEIPRPPVIHIYDKSFRLA